MVYTGGDHKDGLAPSPLPWAGCPPPDQAAQGPIQPGLGYLQGCDRHSSPGQPVSVSPCPLSKEFPPYI